MVKRRRVDGFNESAEGETRGHSLRTYTNMVPWSWFTPKLQLNRQTFQFRIEKGGRKKGARTVGRYYFQSGR